MRRRSDFFLQPLEPRKLLSAANAGNAAPASDASRADQSASSHSPDAELDQQVAQLRSALREMADRMQHLQRVLGEAAHDDTSDDTSGAPTH